LEKTILESFCAASNIKAFLQTESCPDIIQKAGHLLDGCWGDEVRGTLMQDMRSLHLSQECPTASREEIDWNGRKPLPSDIGESLTQISAGLRAEIPEWIMPKKVFFHDRWTIGGRQFATFRALRKDSIVFFELEVGGEMVPGVIRDIFSVHCRTKDDDEYVEIPFLAIHAYHRSKVIDDPFRSFPDFGASIWSANLEDRPVVIPTWR
jgi:hypothetical protein